MAKSERQKSLKKKAMFFGILSYGILITLVLVYTISALIMFKNKPDDTGIQVFTDEIKKAIIATSITAVVGIILSFFLKEGVRTFLWIICVVLGSLVFKEIGMYVALSLWLVDDYIIHNIYDYFKQKYVIRKEIDHE